MATQEPNNPQASDNLSTGVPMGMRADQRDAVTTPKPSPEYVTIHEATVKDALVALRTLRRLIIHEGVELTAETRAELATSIANLIGDIINDARASNYFRGGEVRHG